ncbi:hypothetical protein WS71_28020 [Burkholderia mayonis]|uniref:Uncharacterized protein n=1 Tax=Burkholderia mayonis TaxID=1385591 RepID=A0A1B4G510_9BURK|nr:hypothetical protein WS71_28020 [Burkholderia mayonis]KVE48578.1 hypothetical protein WS71_18145 [Burkholderia mayonis]
MKVRWRASPHDARSNDEDREMPCAHEAWVLRIRASSNRRALRRIAESPSGGIERCARHAAARGRPIVS